MFSATTKLFCSPDPGLFSMRISIQDGFSCFDPVEKWSLRIPTVCIARSVLRLEAETLGQSCRLKVRMAYALDDRDKPILI